MLLATVTSINAQQKDFPKITGPYLGQKPPGMTPEVFVPGIVSSSEALEYGMAFTPDGREFYFNRSGVGVMVCTWTDTGWTAPIKAPFLEKYKGGAVHIMYDGKRLLLNRYPEAHGLKEGEPGGIWSLQKNDADWGNPKFLIKDGMRATSTRDGTIYTTDISGRKEGKDEGIIARYVYSDSGYQRSANPDGGVNTENSEAHPFIAPDESYIIFDATRPEGEGKGDLYICYRLADGTWSQAFNSTLLNTEDSDWCATVSPDGKYLFFTRNGTGKGDIYWVSAKIIEEQRPKEQSKNINESKIKMKTLKSITVIVIYIIISCDLTFSQSPKNNGYNSQSTRIIVPAGNGDKIVSDGIFSKGEWSGAHIVSIAEDFNLYIIAYSGNLYIGLKSAELIGVMVSEIYFTSNEKEYFNLHSSSALGEGINTFGNSPKFTVNSNKGWEANTEKQNMERLEKWKSDGKPIEKYSDTHEKLDGKEYKVSLNKFEGKHLRMKMRIIFVKGATKKIVNYPKNSSFDDSNDWIELIIPAEK